VEQHLQLAPCWGRADILGKVRLESLMACALRSGAGIAASAAAVTNTRGEASLQCGQG